MSDKPVREYDKFMLRFPDGMRDAIAERAKANGRSMNSEIVSILEDRLYCGDGDLDDMDVNEMLEVIKMQRDLLKKYSEFVERGSKTLQEISETLKNNKKST
ncbi:TPA: Arc family DNA-binding protein [Klebsiella pneumoniae]|uniref:Arc family DNA-binding protein n=1 Tax=Klebsiella pneumoniae TaxID=573 RepID=UPI0016460771|nr:Arc family DNA-binding protein [Klebsiella pneumoniae]HDS5531882.1 Arc family DNA-binding protein [Klebsiella pneumoniae subsp. pneumoniae]MBC4246240.1 Arc family DNA-binding protein [Klebsiella pneumoniae]MBX4631747.1 DNA-binding protein [Klebsiella pneumoniae]HBS7886127.1 Arc family DNA-binding protein [Klebsiella pneumoniae]HBW7210691.1 Arc family DNA-binding protein [Klebsiella pneumoniae]